MKIRKVVKDMSPGRFGVIGGTDRLFVRDVENRNERITNKPLIVFCIFNCNEKGKWKSI